MLVVAPTGGGKSLTYQVPAAVLEGMTLVLSPLVALMEDQVRALDARGVPATFLASTLDPDQRRRRETSMLRGEYKMCIRDSCWAASMTSAVLMKSCALAPSQNQRKTTGTFSFGPRSDGVTSLNCRMLPELMMSFSGGTPAAPASLGVRPSVGHVPA